MHSAERVDRKCSQGHGLLRSFFGFPPKFLGHQISSGLDLYRMQDRVRTDPHRGGKFRRGVCDLGRQFGNPAGSVSAFSLVQIGSPFRVLRQLRFRRFRDGLLRMSNCYYHLGRAGGLLCGARPSLSRIGSRLDTRWVGWTCSYGDWRCCLASSCRLEIRLIGSTFSWRMLRSFG